MKQLGKWALRFLAILQSIAIFQAIIGTIAALNAFHLPELLRNWGRVAIVHNLDGTFSLGWQIYFIAHFLLGAILAWWLSNNPRTKLNNIYSTTK